jgi:hypothetical protein
MAVTRIHHVANPAAIPVATGQGEFLLFRVHAGGPVPKFRLSSDIKGALLHQGLFPQDPAPLYEWTYLRDPSDIQQFEILTLGLLFAANASYRYVVTVQGPAAASRTVLDVEYTGAPADFDDESFRILIV